MTQLLPLEREHRSVVKGDDYLKADGRALVWESRSFPNLEGAKLTLVIGYDNTNIFGQKVVKLEQTTQPSEAAFKHTAEVEIKNTQWKELGESLYDYVLRAELTDKSIVTLASGKLTVAAEPGQAPLLPPF